MELEKYYFFYGNQSVEFERPKVPVKARGGMEMKESITTKSIKKDLEL